MEAHVSGVSDGVSTGSNKPGVTKVQPAACLSPEMHVLHLNNVNPFAPNKVCQFQNETVKHYWLQVK